MAEETSTTAQSPTAPSTDYGSDARAAAPTTAQPANKPNESRKVPPLGENDPMRELLEHLERAQPFIADLDRNLAQTIQTLALQGADPERRIEPAFRHRVAYAVQDLGKSAVWPMAMAPELRSEMTRLAATAPGLENERMRALMRVTASLEDTPLIRDLREIGAEIGRQTDQNTPSIQSSIEALENRVRLSLRPAEPQSDPRHAASERPHGANVARATNPSTHDNPASQRSPAFGQSYPRGTLDTIFRGMRPKAGGPGAPWDPAPTPMVGRLAAFESRMQERRDERALGRAEKSGRAAHDALHAFRTGEGAIVMNRIRAAAHAEPGGIAAVLSEMRQGGRFADLRQQFNNALETERGVAAAYDKAAAALARYGQDRVGIEQVVARRPDAANLSVKFEQLDAQVGEAAGGTPSRRDGKSMMDDLAQKAAELLHRAADAVRSAFNRSPSAGAAPRAAPAPSMSI
jgi:hypothetical protein